MITRRDVWVAVAGMAITAGCFALADKARVMGSAVFDWNAVAAKPNSSGSARSFFKERTATLDELEVHVTTLEPGKAPHPPHKHGNEELLIIKQGTVEALVSGEWKRAGPGSVIFLASNQMHGVRNVGSDEAIYHVVAWRTPATPANAPQ